MENDPEFDLIKPSDAVNIILARNNCNYRWSVPSKVYKSSRFQNMKDSLKDEDLLSLGCILLDIVVFSKYSIDFKQNTGVRKLEVSVRSSESDDKQLLHKLTSEFRTKDKQLNRDSIPGTNKENE